MNLLSCLYLSDLKGRLVPRETQSRFGRFSIGAQIVVEIPDIIFKRILSAVMLAVLFLTLFSPTKRLTSGTENLGLLRKIIGVVLFFLIGVYGGFIQAGVGFIVIAALTITNGFDLVRTNAIKVFVIFFYTIMALIIFIKSRNVEWSLGLTLAIGNATGAWVGSQWAVVKGDKWIRLVLVITVLVFSIRLFWQTLGS